MSSTFLYLLSSNDRQSEYSKIYILFYFIELILIEILFAISEAILYRKVTKAMKNSLNFYYKKYKANLKILTIVNIIFFLLVALFNSLIAVLQYNDQDAISSIVGWSNNENSKTWLRILYISITLVVDIFMFMYRSFSLFWLQLKSVHLPEYVKYQL